MQEVSPKSKSGLSAAALKWIAIILMFLNHICYSLNLYAGADGYFVSEASWYLTRIAFIIFAYQLAEGMHYTRNRRKYILSMVIFAVVSEIPYDLCFSHALWDLSTQNVMWTLAVGAAAIALIDKAGKKLLPSLLITLAAMALCTLLNSDYESLGVVTVVSFYVFRENRPKQFVITGLLFALFCFLSYMHSYAAIGLTIQETLATDRFWYLNKLELHALAAWPLLMLYRGKKGKNISKWFFYAFYPGHLLLIYLLTLLLAA